MTEEEIEALQNTYWRVPAHPQPLNRSRIYRLAKTGSVWLLHNDEFSTAIFAQVDDTDGVCARWGRSFTRCVRVTDPMEPAPALKTCSPLPPEPREYVPDSLCMFCRGYMVFVGSVMQGRLVCTSCDVGD